MKMERPILIRKFLKPEILSKIQKALRVARGSPELQTDTTLVHRHYVHNNPVLDLFHSEVIAKETQAIFGEKLKPSYSFASLYFEGKGFCPLHTDRPQCYRTIDVCINQKQPWPLFINHLDGWNENLTQDERERIKQRSVEYVLEPGDAICYSGTDHPHWRNTIDEGNSCDLVFFHFVPEDFEGELD